MECLLDSQESFVQNFCKSLRCSVVARGLNRLNFARDMLNIMQNMSALDESSKMEKTSNMVISEEENIVESSPSQSSISTSNMGSFSDDIERVEEECEEFYSDLVFKEDMDNKWNEYFSNFHMVSNWDDYSVCDERKAVRLLVGSCGDEIEFFLRKGVRCFIIDMFIGTKKENQASIIRLREKEFEVSKEFGFPICSSLVASLSPRLQYIGKLIEEDEGAVLEVGDEVTITTNRNYSSIGTRELFYVNAYFLLYDLLVCDGIFIGPDIQVVVKNISFCNVTTVVIHKGKLRSRLPVLFPSHCSRLRMSMEELEDITFCKEVGITAVISYAQGTKQYFDELQECFNLLKCDKMRLGARVVINAFTGLEDDFKWMVESYDLFLLDIDPNEIKKSEILHVCESGKKFINLAYDLKKLILFDPIEIIRSNYAVSYEDYSLIFHLPDRYLLQCNDLAATHSFFELQSSIFDEARAANIFCDRSITGSDSLAHACISASLEMNASLILVCTDTGRMAEKLAHFRPKAPIFFITSLAAETDFMGYFWNITILYFLSKKSEFHDCNVFKQLLFGLIYAKSQNMVKNNDNVILVYGEEPGTKFSDVFQVFKFNEKTYVKHLNNLSFPKTYF